VFFLLCQGAKIIVVARNTASAASLSHLRETFEVRVVGMEPAGRPDAERGE
jgi:glutamate racemase